MGFELGNSLWKILLELSSLCSIGLSGAQCQKL
jgi:hypothetical protein